MSTISLPTPSAQRIGSQAGLAGPGGAPRSVGVGNMLVDGVSAQSLYTNAPVSGMYDGDSRHTGLEAYLEQAATFQLECPPSAADKRLADYDLAGFPIWTHKYRPDSWIQTYLSSLDDGLRNRVVGARRGNVASTLFLTPAALNLLLAEELATPSPPTPAAVMENFPLLGVGHNQMPADQTVRTPRMLSIASIGRTPVHALFGRVSCGDFIWAVAERAPRPANEGYVVDPIRSVRLQPEEPVGFANGLPVSMRPRLTSRPIRVRFVRTRGEAPEVPLCQTEDGIDQRPHIVGLGRVLFVGQRGDASATASGNVDHSVMQRAADHELIVEVCPVE